MPRHTSSVVAKRVIASHKALTEAIAARDAAGACALIRRRLETIRAYKAGQASRKISVKSGLKRNKTAKTAA